MVLDDSKWFAAQKKIADEWAPVKDEMLRIIAKPVRSDFEMMVEDEFLEWSTHQPEIMTYQQALNKFWNERLN